MSVNPLASSPIGRLVQTEGGLSAYLPNPIPRDIELSPKNVVRVDRASRTLGTLVGVGETITNPHLLIAPFMRREAVLSSRIEGTQASLSDVFLYEVSGSQRVGHDVDEVINYIAALEAGIAMLEDLPISRRLVNVLHGFLLAGVRGQDKNPGEFRSGQVYIGTPGTPIQEARFIPPPPSFIENSFQDWETYANQTIALPPIAQCAILHYQFEAIHPYIDGNGRIGRLLITLFLIASGLLTQPLLYLSAYFERDRQRYYDELFNVSASGDWQRWIGFFLDGVTEQAHDALVRTRQLRDLETEYRSRLQNVRASGNVLAFVEHLFASPYATAPRVQRLLGITNQGAHGVLKKMESAGVLTELEGSWPKAYLAKELMDLLEDD